MFWRAWIGAVLAAVAAAGAFMAEVKSPLTAVVLGAISLLLTLACAWIVDRTHRRLLAQAAANAAPSTLPPAAAVTVAKAEVPSPRLRESFTGISDRLQGLRRDAATSQTQIHDIWALLGRVNDLLSGLSKATANQLSDLDRTQSVARQVVDGAVNMTEVVRQVRAGTLQRRGAAQRVESGLSNITEGMEAIKRAVNGSGQRIQELSQHSSEIGEIVRVIRTIADQTNMLSLNAAIEAARAGAAGRGFAVVADEVRKLADRSRQATRQIEDLVKTIREGTQAATEAMNEGQAEVSRGTAIVEGSQGAIEEILESAELLDRTVEDFGGRAEETTARMTELLAAVEEITRLAEENNAAMKEVADADWFSVAIKKAEAAAAQVHKGAQDIDTALSAATAAVLEAAVTVSGS